MSKRQYHIFYLMMQADGIYEKSVEIHEVKRHLPIPSGSVSLYYALWPEYRRKSLFRKKPKEWKVLELQKELEKLKGRAECDYDCWEMLYSRQFQEKAWPMAAQDLPFCILQAWLYAQRPFDTLYLPEEWNQGMQDAEQLMELLIPYLPRLKQVVWMGEEGTVSESLQNYLYEEYGMILLFDRRIPDGAVVIRRAQAWKFLDATVKNGYNTLVHYGNIRRI